MSDIQIGLLFVAALVGMACGIAWSVYASWTTFAADLFPSEDRHVGARN